MSSKNKISYKTSGVDIALGEKLVDHIKGIKEKEKRLLNISKNSQTFEAVIRTSGRKGYFQPDNDTDTNTWFFVEPELMSEYLNMNFENQYYLEAVNNGPNGFPLGNQTRIYLRNNHLQYAITWFLMSFSILIICFTVSVVIGSM